MMNELSMEPQNEKEEEIGNFISQNEEKDKKMKLEDIIKLSDEKIYDIMFIIGMIFFSRNFQIEL